MTSALNIVILAAGQGKRMFSNRPKVLHALAGKPLLQHVLDTADQLGADRICVVYGHGGAAVPTSFADAKIAWAKQEPQMGTGHAVMQALTHIAPEGITLILYGDVPLVRVDTLRPLVAAAKSGSLALLTVELPDPTGYGRVIRQADGKVSRIVEQRDAGDDELGIREVNSGIMAVPSGRLEGWLQGLENRNAQQEYYLTDLIAMATRDGAAVQAFQPAFAWECAGVNSNAQLAELERVVQLNQAADLMAQGVTLTDPARIEVRGGLQCARDVSIDIDCIFEGSVSLGPDVRVGAHCILRNVSIGAGTAILPFTYIEDTAIGENCRIGPYTRIRPGTKLDDEVHLGNFVEVKNSEIGKRSKANHLTYLGDTTVGKSVNIGAGTITCNYDGANKYRTVIEDGAFIGSDTQLVAPVTVGRGSTIGAGATITRDTPPDQLTLSRAKQVSIPGWQKPTKKPS
jgi:bifunctional UDP-N-acetylglucosamine pyrophosphorylase / glucosamine-1-phosphate N-acetyltransferase